MSYRHTHWHESQDAARHDQDAAHAHQCRDCSAEFECHAVEGRNGCDAFTGSCADCDPFYGSPWRPGDASNVVSRGAW